MKLTPLLFVVFVFVMLSGCSKKNTASSTVKPEFIRDGDFTPLVLESDQLVVVDFWASWCGPCKMMDPVLQDFATEYRDVKFVKIDVDRDRNVKEEYNVYGLPTLMFFKDGKEISRQVGLTTENTVRNRIERWR